MTASAPGSRCLAAVVCIPLLVGCGADDRSVPGPRGGSAQSVSPVDPGPSDAAEAVPDEAISDSGTPDTPPAADTQPDTAPAPDLPPRDAPPTSPDVVSAQDTARPAPCPPEMTLVSAARGPSRSITLVCVDRFEARLQEEVEPGVWVDASPYLTVGRRIVRAVPAQATPPQGYISGSQAAEACERSGKRLCTSQEWLLACRGAQDRLYPYGDAYLAGACNDTFAGHPVVNYFGTNQGIWDPEHMNDPGINQQPDSLAAGGAFTACVTPDGVFDLHGNLHEWVADASGVFRGGFYADAAINGQGCSYATTAHAPGYHDYSTGFRCCRDPAP